MPTTLCSFKNIDEFLSKYDKAGWASIQKKEKVGIKDKVKFSQVIGAGKEALRKAYQDQVEDSPAITKYLTTINNLEKAIETKAPALEGAEEANHNIKMKMSFIKALEEQADMQNKDPKKDPRYKTAKLELKDMVKESQALIKLKKEHDTLQKKLKDVTASCEKKKKDIGAKLGVSVKSDGKQLIVYIGKRDEVAVKVTNS